MMKTMLLKNQVGTQSEVALHLMINQLAVSTLPTALRRRNQVVNDISPELLVNTDQQKLAAVLGTLLQELLGHSTDCLIRVSAKEFSNVTLIHIKDNKSAHGQSFQGNLAAAQQIAMKIGSAVFVNNFRDGSTTIAVSVVNQPVDALLAHAG